MNESWSEQLVKKGISEFLIDELDEHLSNKKKLESAKKLLSMPILDESDLKTLKESIESLSEDLPEDYIDYLLEECDEMEDDIEWASSDKGKEILSINNWVQQFYEEFRAMSEYDEALIGSHAEKSVIFVTGKVSNKKVMNSLKKYVLSKNPFLEVLMEVNISA